MHTGQTGNSRCPKSKTAATIALPVILDENIGVYCWRRGSGTGFSVGDAEFWCHAVVREEQRKGVAD